MYGANKKIKRQWEEFLRERFPFCFKANREGSIDSKQLVDVTGRNDSEGSEDNNGIQNEKNYLVVKKALLNIIKIYPERYDFNEMLVWLFMQNKKYKMALSHIISIDRRTNNSLDKIYTISETFLDLEKYDLAIEALDYIISKGFNSKIYIDSQINKYYVYGVVARLAILAAAKELFNID